MLYISHRGNIDKKDINTENSPSKIELCIKSGYDVEIDIRYIYGGWWLGHDENQYEVSAEWINKIHRKLWIHCKNVDAISKLHELDRGGFYLNYFWHENDKVTLTSQGYIWAYPGVKCSNGIAVMPELNKNFLPKDVLGICSDYIINYE